MRLVAGWAREAGLEPGLDALRQPVGAAPAVRTARWSPRARTSTPSPTAAATTARWGRCWASRVAGRRWAARRRRLLVCAAEEAPRFGAGTMGSRQMVGTLTEDALDHLHDADGVSAADARAAYLQELGDLPRIAPPLDRLRAHAEVHVAQRRALRELGVVTAVASPRRFAVAHRRPGRPLRRGVDGRPPRRAGGGRRGGARRRGGGARRARRDRRHRRHPGRRARVRSASSRAARASAVDVRGIASESLRPRGSGHPRAVDEIAARRGVTARAAADPRRRAGDDGPPAWSQAALQAAREHGIPATETWSGAGHDAQHVTALAAGAAAVRPAARRREPHPAGGRRHGRDRPGGASRRVGARADWPRIGHTAGGAEMDEIVQTANDMAGTGAPRA